MVRVEDVPEDDLEAQVTTDEFIYIYIYIPIPVTQLSQTAR